MTHYDKLIDHIKMHLNAYYVSGQANDGWSESDGDVSARRIFEAVEEFQEKCNTHQWRATD
jgi:hypothetical protein